MTAKEKKIFVGAHTSIAGGIANALWRGQEIGATTIQIFTANQKQWHGKEFSDADVDEWFAAKEETGIDKIMSHDSYLINLGSPKADLLKKSHDAFEREIKRCHKLELDYLNFHPGAATTFTEEECLDQIVTSLLTFEKHCAKGKTRLLLETTAGQGSSIGHDFAQLGYILKEVKGKIPIGVCIDTCHIFSAGYDIRTRKAWDATLEEFDDQIGIKHLYAFHVNDSMKPLASRRDRHANLGDGEIGIEAFKVLMSHPKLKDLPKYLETPNGDTKWADEIALLRSFAK